MDDMIGGQLQRVIKLRNNDDMAWILFTHCPKSVEAVKLISLCAEYGNSEILRVVLDQFKTRHMKKEWTAAVRESLTNARKEGHHQIVLEFLTQPRDSKTGKAVASVLAAADDTLLLVELACMHVDVLRLILHEYESFITDTFRCTLLSCAGRMAGVEVVQELIDNHQDEFGDWTVDHFNDAADHNRSHVLQYLSLTRNGMTKLIQNPPLNYTCTREVLKERHLNSAMMLMLCIKKQTTSQTMARLIDPLRDLISGDLMRYETTTSMLLLQVDVEEEEEGVALGGL
jgi:hypothetical protein